MLTNGSINISLTNKDFLLGTIEGGELSLRASSLSLDIYRRDDDDLLKTKIPYYV